MRMLLLSTVTASWVFPISASAADGHVSFGAGLGALYNGVGINLALMNDADLKYVSLGCTSLATSSSYGTTTNCGIGAGWMRSDILSESGRHGLGVHLGVTYNTYQNRDDTEAFIGIPYAYFFNRMDATGVHLGLTPFIGRLNDETRAGYLLNLGYQF